MADHNTLWHVVNFCSVTIFIVLVFQSLWALWQCIYNRAAFQKVRTQLCIEILEVDVYPNSALYCAAT